MQSGGFALLAPLCQSGFGARAARVSITSGTDSRLHSLGGDHALALIGQEAVLAVQDRVARDVPCLFQLEELRRARTSKGQMSVIGARWRFLHGVTYQVLRSLVSVRRRVDLKPPTTAALARLDLSDDDVVLEVQGLDSLQLRREQVRV